MVRSLRRVLALATISLVYAAAPAVAQSTGGGGSGGAGSTPSTPPRTPGNTPTTPSNIPQQQPGQTPWPTRPIVLSGKVILDDGTAPQDTVVLELICNGVAKPQGHTDSSGGFNFTVDQNPTEALDAAYGPLFDPIAAATASRNRSSPQVGVPGLPEAQRISERDLQRCELHAVLAGYTSDSLPMSGRRALDEPDVGTIILHRIASVSGFTYSITSAAAPKDAKKAFDKGLELRKKNKDADAELQFKKATQAYPKFAVAWYELGRSQIVLNKFEEARKSLAASLEIDPRYVYPNLELAMVSFREMKWDDVATYGDRVTRLDPYSFPLAYYVTSVARIQLKQPAAAEKNARELLKLDTQHRFPRGVQVLAVALAQQKKYPEALEQMRNYLQLAPDAPEAPAVKRDIRRLMELSGELPSTAAVPSAKEEKQ